MESYTNFAKVYDEFMDQTPYDRWCLNILQIFREYGIPEHARILELGCGTGKMTRRLADKGYEMTAADNSLDMLEIAANMGNDHILYVLQDMTQLEMPAKADAVISICDCINYILTEEELSEVFVRVRNNMNEKGVFLFDINSRYKYENLLGQNTFAEDREEASFIWDNFYDEEDRVNEYQLSLFIKNEQGTYNKYEELHLQKAYDVEEIRNLLYQAGFGTVKVLDCDTMKPAKEDTERLYFIASI